MGKTWSGKVVLFLAVMMALAGPASAEFAYVANDLSNNVSGYTINAATGALTPIAGSPFPAGTNPVSVTVDPTGKFAYVANSSSDNVSGYTINAATGALTPIAGSPFPAGTTPRSVTVDPSGKFAYVANQGGNVSGYTINAATGALTPVAGSPFPAGTGPIAVTVDPSGKFAYVANFGSSDVSGYIQRAMGQGAPTPLKLSEYLERQNSPTKPALSSRHSQAGVPIAHLSATGSPND